MRSWPAGAAMLAGLGAGIYRDSADAVRQTRREKKIYTPDTTRHGRYRVIFEEAYRHVYPSLRQIHHQIDCLMKREA